MIIKINVNIIRPPILLYPKEMEVLGAPTSPRTMPHNLNISGPHNFNSFIIYENRLKLFITTTTTTTTTTDD